MRVLVVGATGLIGRAIVDALKDEHDVIPVSHRHSAVMVDLADPASIARMYRQVGKVDAVISAAGQAKFGAFATLTGDDFLLGLHNKLMGQVNLVRFGHDHVADGGSFTLTSGVLAQHPMPGSAAVSPVNAGLEGFVRAAALELPRRIRVNVVSPGWITETLQALGMDPTPGMPAARVAKTYVESLRGTTTGAVLSPFPE
jgi:NAD(P)-dependent dehydrogenase (short-subunit alcohol dehydrogenase family)